MNGLVIELLSGECTERPIIRMIIIPHLSLSLSLHCHALSVSLQLMDRHKTMSLQERIICHQLGESRQLADVWHCGVEEAGRHFITFTVV